jgi:transposase
MNENVLDVVLTRSVLLRKGAPSMSKRQYHVELTPDQAERLRAIGYTGAHKVYQVVHARLLLKAAAGLPDREIADTLDVGLSTVARLRKIFCTEGLEACLGRKEQHNRFRKVTGDIQARIAKIACEAPPQGFESWTLDLITERVVELKILPSISRSTVAECLKKTKSSPG